MIEINLGSFNVTNAAGKTGVRIPTNMVGFQIHVYPGMSRTSSKPESALGFLLDRLDFQFLIWANKQIVF